MNPFAPRTRIKICGLTREQDVDAAVAAGADAIGFVLYAKSPRYVSPQRAAELARRLPPFVTPVLLFVNETAINTIAAYASLAGATAQFHGEESPEQCWAAAQHGARPYLRAARIPLGDAGAGFDLVRWWRANIQLVTAASKRQRSPRLEWWAERCQRDRRHSGGAPAL
jgi:phosphoribosylanthranilate isomerase